MGKQDHIRDRELTETTDSLVSTAVCVAAFVIILISICVSFACPQQEPKTKSTFTATDAEQIYPPMGQNK